MALWQCVIVVAFILYSCLSANISELVVLPVDLIASDHVISTFFVNMSIFEDDALGIATEFCISHNITVPFHIFSYIKLI